MLKCPGNIQGTDKLKGTGTGTERVRIKLIERERERIALKQKELCPSLFMTYRFHCYC